MGTNDSGSTESLLGILTPGGLNDPATQAATHNAANVLAASQSTGALAKDHGTDSSYVQTREAFESWTLPDMYKSAQQMQPGNIHSASETLRDIGGYVEQAGILPHAQVLTAMNGTWTGANADAAQAAVETLAKASMQGGDIIQAVGLRLQAIAYGAEALKAAIPPPTIAIGIGSGNPALSPSAILNPSGAVDQHAQQEAQRQAAVAAMNAIYKPTYWPAGEGVPSYSPPPDVAPGASGPGSANFGGGRGGGPGGTGSGPGPSAQQPDSPQQGEPLPGQNSNAGQPGTNGGQGQGSQPAGANGGDGASSTKAAGYNDGGLPGTGFGNPVGDGFGGGTGGFGGGGGGAGGGVGGAGPLAEPTLGGGPIPVSRGPLGGMSPAARAGGAGGAGMPGPGAKKDKKDDKEHKIKPYLVTTENTEELLGDDQRTVPPVLGAQWDGNPKQ